MNITCTEAGNALVIHYTGDIDHHSAAALSARLEEIVEDACPEKLLFDLPGLAFMDSSALAVLMRLKRLMDESGGKLALGNVPAQAEKVLRAAGMTRLIPIFAPNA